MKLKHLFLMTILFACTSSVFCGKNYKKYTRTVSAQGELVQTILGQWSKKWTKNHKVNKEQREQNRQNKFSRKN